MHMMEGSAHSHGGNQEPGDNSQMGGGPVFHTGLSETLLFPSLIVTTYAELTSACIVVFLVALLYEGLRLFVPWLQIYINVLPQGNRGRLWSLGALQTASYMLHMFFGYCLMLIFMTLNVWLCLALLLGAGAGFLLFHFRPVKSRFFRLLKKGRNCEQDSSGEEECRPVREGDCQGYKKLEKYQLSYSGAMDKEAGK